MTPRNHGLTRKENDRLNAGFLSAVGITERKSSYDMLRTNR